MKKISNISKMSTIKTVRTISYDCTKNSFKMNMKIRNNTSFHTVFNFSLS